jgi:hypothetical protein
VEPVLSHDRGRRYHAAIGKIPAGTVCADEDGSVWIVTGIKNC